MQLFQWYVFFHVNIFVMYSTEGISLKYCNCQYFKSREKSTEWNNVSLLTVLVEFLGSLAKDSS